jgi:hypothetical protein
MDLEETEARNVSAGEAEQQFDLLEKAHTSTVILGSESHGTQGHSLLSDGSRSLQN